MKTNDPILDRLLNFYIEIKCGKHGNTPMSDEQFLKILSCCTIPRKVFTESFDKLVKHKEIEPLESFSEPVKEELRNRIKPYCAELSQAERLQMGKCAAMLDLMQNI